MDSSWFNQGKLQTISDSRCSYFGGRRYRGREGHVRRGEGWVLGSMDGAIQVFQLTVPDNGLRRCIYLQPLKKRKTEQKKLLNSGNNPMQGEDAEEQQLPANNEEASQNEKK
ncbi:uncharacterized protein LOC110695622 [Chenopodium quinoa]|uniref:uncharacterized protein LOC110695622 n=1 Tax=Chenopodium quinoa TaxID=63459 RepID=UPI000B77A509|nr:uncharacterized protein LOC110695622 [Chenopodium quinoa]